MQTDLLMAEAAGDLGLLSASVWLSVMPLSFMPSN